MEDRLRAAFNGIRADDALVAVTLAYLRKVRENRRITRKTTALPARLAAVAAMILLTVGLISHNMYFTAAAHISIDVNPSVELTLNRFDRVIDAYAFNEDGAGVLNETALRGKTCGEAVRQLLAIIEDNGYISEDVLISVTVQAVSGDRERALCEALSRFVGECVLPAQASAEIEVFSVSAEVWNNARGCHMSPVRFLAVQALMEIDETAAPDDYADMPISQIRMRTQERHNGHTAPDESEPTPAPQSGQDRRHEGGHGRRGWQ